MFLSHRFWPALESVQEATLTRSSHGWHRPGDTASLRRAWLHVLPKLPPLLGPGGPYFLCPDGRPFWKEFLQLLIRIFSLPGIQTHSLGKKHLALLSALLTNFCSCVWAPNTISRGPFAWRAFLHVEGKGRAGEMLSQTRVPRLQTRLSSQSCPLQFGPAVAN